MPGKLIQPKSGLEVESLFVLRPVKEMRVGLKAQNERMSAFMFSLSPRAAAPTKSFHSGAPISLSVQCTGSHEMDQHNTDRRYPK